MTRALPAARGLRACRRIIGGLWVSMLAVLLPIPARPATLIVPTDYATIQAAINAAQPLDLIVVEPGTYTENLVLRSDLRVVGREAARTLLQPQSAQVPTVDISLASDLRFSNFTLLEAGTAIDVAASAGVVISNIVFDSARDVAIEVTESEVEIAHNVFFDNRIAVRRNSVAATVTNNIFRSNAITISSPDLLVDNNVNVEANCYSDNADLIVGGTDTGYGRSFVLGNPLFVDPVVRDFHLQESSPCIDIGVGTDVIDDTVADAGAYGGEFADARPFPLDPPVLTDASTASTVDILVDWEPNLSYLVTSAVLPGSYLLHYAQGTPGPPYAGDDADGGTQASPIDVGSVSAYTLSDLAPLTSAPQATRLLSAAGFDQSVVLTWEPVDGASGYRIHYGLSATDESEVDTGKVTTYTVTDLVNGSEYRFAVGTLAQATYYVAVTARDSTPARHESVYSEGAAIELGEAAEGPLSNELTALPELTAAYPALPDQGGACFIATAAYGADWQAEVQILRDFRDRYLLTNAVGEWLVQMYYRVSPRAAHYLNEHATLKPIVRWILTPAMLIALFLLGSTTLVKAGTGALVVLLIAQRYWRPARIARTRTDRAAQ
jgi:hypothetical protein